MTTETLMTDGQTTQQADSQQAETSTQGQRPTAQTTEQAATQQQVEGKQAETKKEGEQPQGEQKTEAEAKQEGAPEKYEFASPEGVQFDEGVITAFSEVAKELNLTQDGAQKVLDKVAPVIAERQTEAIKAVQKQWTDESTADKDFGGANLQENLAIAKRGLETYGTPELVKLLNESGMGNHPEVIRAFYRMGKTVKEDSFVGGDKGHSTSKTIAQQMYPNMNP